MELLRKEVNDYYRGSEPADVVVQVVIALTTLYILQTLIFNKNARQKMMQIGFKGLKSIPGVQGAIGKEKDKVRKMIYDKLAIQDQPKHLQIPDKALSHDEIINKLKEMSELDRKHWKSGKVSGTVYEGQEDHTNFLNKVFSMFSLNNPLHPDVFPSTRKFEAEIVRMTADMVQGDSNVCGAVTSGGTESILMAVKAYRDRAKLAAPEMIVPVTAHAAFDKAASYFGIKIIHIPVDSNFVVDVKQVEAAITRNTIMIAGSAPNYPYGTVDPIPQLAALAKKNNIGFHTDGCLGGYLLPWLKKAGVKEITNFDFSVDGVTSMSVDTHKYGYATKGTSVVLLKDEKLRHHMYFVQPNWPGGMYASPTMAGSRNGGVVACCYASLLSNGKEGYTAKSMAIYRAAQEIKTRIQSEIPSLHLLGDSHSSVIAFGSKKFDIYKVGDLMSKKGWNLNTLQNPNSLHVCVTFPLSKIAPDFVRDLKASAEELLANPNAAKDGMAAIYGMAANFPDRATIGEIGLAFLDAVLTP
eukprot:TRINITY_DN498_c0_g1_i2.p1 TRINITY_DN498_c0_g1~~TRINITY_DN498_c0_g1_i2.p1  ORF type:complete len:525 (-),score=128.59 TRINITY_DN498_c0_g1_i2:83-1657(-)